METLNITLNDGKGRINIFLDKFFPCTKKDFKKLLSIISLDWQYEHELREKLKVYFQEKKAEHENMKKHSAKMHLENRQLEADSKEMITTRKRSNGIPLSKDELAEEKEKLGKYKRYAAIHLSYYRQHEKEEKQFSEYLKLL